MNVQIEEALRLLSLAERDQRAFAVLYAHTSLTDFPVAAFHAQQSVEKAFKAVLCVLGIEYRRTHDLTELAGRIQDRGLSLPISEENLLRLTPYAVELRYDENTAQLITPETARMIVSEVLCWAKMVIDNP